MAGSFRSVGNGMVRVQPGRMSLGRFCREAVVPTKRRRVAGWTAWAQPLLPDMDGLAVRCEGGLVAARGDVALWVQVEGKGIVIRSSAGRRKLNLPAQAVALLAAEVLGAVESAKCLRAQFWSLLERGEHPDRAVKGAIIQVRDCLRHGRGKLTPGLLRRVWSALDLPFGAACMAVAAKVRANPGRVRVVLTRYGRWWKTRRADSPHWLDGLTRMLGYPRAFIAASVTSNKWWHHRRRRRTDALKWWRPRKRTGAAKRQRSGPGA